KANASPLPQAGEGSNAVPDPYPTSGYLSCMTRSSSASYLSLMDSVSLVSQSRKTGSPLSMAKPMGSAFSSLLMQASPLGKTIKPGCEALRRGQTTLSIGPMSARPARISSIGPLAPEPDTPRNFMLGKRLGAQVSGGVPIR